LAEFHKLSFHIGMYEKTLLDLTMDFYVMVNRQNVAITVAMIKTAIAIEMMLKELRFRKTFD